MGTAVALRLSDAEDVSVAEIEQFAASAREWRDCIRNMNRTDAGEAAIEGWNQLAAVERYVQDAKARRAAQAETRRTEILIGELLGEAKQGRPEKVSNYETFDLHSEHVATFRFFAAYKNLAERFVDNAVTRRKPLVKAIEDELAKPPPPGTANIVARNWEDWLPGQDNCDLLLTDPPYMTDVDDINAFAADWLPLALSKVKPTGRAYVFIGAYPEELLAYLAVAVPTQVLAWSYRNTIGPSSPGRYSLNWQAILYYCGPEAPPLQSRSLKDRFAAQQINAPDGRFGEGRYHAWQKPMDLAKSIVSLAVGEGSEARILDPFAGTGTHLLAAAETGNHGLGCDINEEMIDIAESRGVSRAR